MTKHDDLTRKLRRWVKDCGGLEAAADLLDISVGYLSHIQTGRRPVSQKLAPRIVMASGGRFSIVELLYGGKS